METNIHKDHVQQAITNFGRPLLLGKIENWEDLFEDLVYAEALPPLYGRNYYPLINSINGSVWFDMAKKITLHAKPKPELIDSVRRAIGHNEIKPPNGGYFSNRESTNLDNLTGFKLIAWEKKGVVLIKANRLDHSDFGTYIGFIDIAKVPTILPGEDYAPKPNRPKL
ncbi:hypothetical protein ACKF11_12800 [Methylobacillus sp. Pita2]|uniref:hypothetical protein n=1 Tax=Methylobacillus sp. Pita2 TaxID=3383245 RepID=UPI0038B6A19D